MAKLTLAAVKSLIDEQTTTLMNEIKILKDEVAVLKTELAAIKTPDQPTSINNLAAEKLIITDAVTASMDAALEEERVKKEVVILKLPERNMDTLDVNELCKNVKPENLIRLGKINERRSRPLKVTFPSSFDARVFMSKIKEMRESNPDEFEIYCRPGRTRKQMALRRKVFEMNQKANGGESFSVRKNGDVWKYKKTDDGKWVREPEWTYLPTSQEIKTDSSSSAPTFSDSHNPPNSPKSTPASHQGNGRNIPSPQRS